MIFGIFDAEFEYMQAEVESDDLSISDIEIDTDTVALYGVYRTAGDLYFKAKLGILSEDASVKSIYGGSSSGRDTGLSAGLGGGYHFSYFSIEGEYTPIEEGVDFIGVGLNYYF
jgi:outer membrane immunogenic protein